MSVSAIHRCLKSDGCSSIAPVCASINHLSSSHILCGMKAVCPSMYPAHSPPLGQPQKGQATRGQAQHDSFDSHACRNMNQGSAREAGDCPRHPECSWETDSAGTRRETHRLLLLCSAEPALGGAGWRPGGPRTAMDWALCYCFTVTCAASWPSPPQAACQWARLLPAHLSCWLFPI